MRGKSFPIFGSGQNLENVNNQKFPSALLLIFVEKVEAVFHTVEKYVQNNSASQRRGNRFEIYLNLLQ